MQNSDALVMAPIFSTFYQKIQYNQDIEVSHPMVSEKTTFEENCEQTTMEEDNWRTIGLVFTISLKGDLQIV